MDDDDVATDVSSDVGDEVPLLARRLSQEEITDALLADAVGDGDEAGSASGGRGGCEDERASVGVGEHGEPRDPAVGARNMRRSD